MLEKFYILFTMETVITKETIKGYFTGYFDVPGYPKLPAMTLHPANAVCITGRQECFDQIKELMACPYVLSARAILINQ